MTIAVRCQCGRQFAVKNELAGKRGKCPKCGSIFQIPHADSSPPQPIPNPPPVPPPSDMDPDGMGNLGSLLDEEGIGVAGQTPIAPGQGKLCPSCRKVVPAQSLLCVECGWNFEEGRKLETKRGPVKRPNDNPYGVDPYFDEEEDVYTGRRRKFEKESSNRTGPAWETDDLVIGRYFQTVVDVLISPAYAFGSMRLKGGFGPPITFVLVGYVITYILVTLLILGFISLIGTFPLTGQKIPPGTIAAMGAAVILGMFCGIVCMLVIAGIFLPIIMFISATILHLFLMIVGGAKRDIEATFRAAGYVSGALVLPAVLVGLIPFVGQYISLVIQGVYTFLAIKYTHENSWWQAAVATVLWVLVIFAIMIAMQQWSEQILLEQIKARNARFGQP